MKKAKKPALKPGKRILLTEDLRFSVNYLPCNAGEFIKTDRITFRKEDYIKHYICEETLTTTTKSLFRKDKVETVNIYSVIIKQRDYRLKSLTMIIPVSEHKIVLSNLEEAQKLYDSITSQL